MFICVYKCTYVCVWVWINADAGQMRTDGVLLNHSTYSFEEESLCELKPHDSSVRLEAKKSQEFLCFSPHFECGFWMLLGLGHHCAASMSNCGAISQAL